MNFIITNGNLFLGNTQLYLQSRSSGSDSNTLIYTSDAF